MRSPSGSEPPEWLSEEARAVWLGLDEAVVRQADRDALVVYCCAVADYSRAQQTLDQTGVVIRGARGGLVRNPLNMIKAENASVIATLARQLGIGGRSEEPARTAKPGRATNALEKELKARGPAIGVAERAALRICARGLDDAEHEHDLTLIDSFSKTYLMLRMAAGLSANSPAKPASDPWDRLADVLAEPRLHDPTQSQ